MGIIVFAIVVILIVTYKLYMRSGKEKIDNDVNNLDEKQKSKDPIIRIRIFDDQYTAKALRARPECLFLFGDNEDRAGTRGQACIRHEPNAVGITTKRRPFMNEDSFYDDDDYEANVASIDESFENLRKRIEASGMEYKFIFIPRDGLGTGLAQLPQRAPKTFVYILSLIYDLASEYDPATLDGPLGEWIQQQTRLARQKRINV
jgi:hypothetical protein